MSSLPVTALDPAQPAIPSAAVQLDALVVDHVNVTVCAASTVAGVAVKLSVGAGVGVGAEGESSPPPPPQAASNAQAATMNAILRLVTSVE